VCPDVSSIFPILDVAFDKLKAMVAGANIVRRELS
jgi:methionine synthase II (cobalamin-independent)